MKLTTGLSNLDTPDENEAENIVNSGVGIYHYVVREEVEANQITDLLDDRSHPKVTENCLE